MAELPFLKADIREIFEIPLKNDFKASKRRRQFWRRSQLGSRRLWCRRPKVMEKQQLGREENQAVMQEQNPANKGPMVIVQVEQQQSQAGLAPQVTVQVQQQGQGWEAPQVTVQVQPQQMGQGWEAPRVTVQVQQPGQGGASLQVTVQVQQPSQGVASPQVTVQVQQQPQGGHDQEGSQVTQAQHQGQTEEGSKALEQQLNQDERESQVNQDGRASKELGGMQGQDKEGTEAMKQQHYQGQDKERSKAVEQLLNLDERELKVRVKDEREPKELELEGMQGQGKKGTEVMEQQQDQSQDEEGSKAVDLQKLSQEKEGLKSMVMEQQQGQGQDKQTMSKKHLREMPNYFVSIPITNDQILDKIEDVQELIFTKEPDLLRALIPVQTMHLTIIVAHLRRDEEVKKAVLALEQSKAKVEAILQGKLFNMTFHGIGQFNNQVIYVKMSDDEQQMLSKIADNDLFSLTCLPEAVEGSFNEMGLDITGSKDFKPHLTFLKLSKVPALRRKGFRKISSDLYKEYEDCTFGTEVFSQIDLCAMHKKKQESGYYHCECSINVGSSSAEANKEQTVKTEYLGEMAIKVPPHGAAEVETGDISAGYNCASYVAKDVDKPAENIAEASVTSKETEINEKDVQPEAKDKTFTADGEVCSQSVSDLLPVSSNALKGVDERQEKAKLADGNLQTVETTEVASDQLNIAA